MTTPVQSSEALKRYEILDTPPEEAFDRIADLATYVFKVPICLVSFVDRDRQWFKSCFGLGQRETGLDVSFCIYAVQSGEMLVVENAAEDERFADNPLVTGSPGIRFYAGAPLVTPEGTAIGTLCVLDLRPRSFGSEEQRRLKQLASMVMNELEVRRQSEEWRQAEALARALNRVLVKVNQNISLDDILDDVAATIEGGDGGLQTIAQVYTNGTTHIGDPHNVGAEMLAVGERVIHESTPEMEVPTVDNGTLPTIDVYLSDADSQAGWSVLLQQDIAALWEARIRDDSGELLGSVIVFSADRRSPNNRERVCIQRMHAMAETAIRRHRDRAALQSAREMEEETRDLLQRSQEIAQVGGWEYHPERDEAKGTEMFYKIIGQPLDKTFSMEQALGIFPDEGRDKVARAVEQCITEGTPFDIEAPLVRHETDQRMVRIRGRAHSDGRRVNRMTGVIQDITDQKRKERRLREKRLLISNILETSPVGITIINKHGYFMLVNRHAEAILGLSQEDIKQRRYDASDWDITHPDGSPMANEELPFDQVMEEGKPVFGAKLAISRPGRSRCILHVNAAPLDIVDGQVESAVIVLKDITDQWMTEQEIRKRREQLQEAQRIAKLGHWYHNPEDRQLTWSEETYRIMGYTVDEPVTLEKIYELIHPEDREYFKSHQRSMIKEGMPVDYEYRIVRGDGDVRTIHERGEADFDDGGRIQMLKGTVQDVTEQKKIEQDLREAKEHAEEMNRLKSAFLANMSHEIRTPLTSILGFSDILSEMNLDKRSQKFADMISRASHRLHDTLISVLDLSELEAGTRNINLRKVAVQSVIRGLVEEFSIQADQAGLELRRSGRRDAIYALADRAALQRILSNLISNAIKFTEEGGRITIDVSEDEGMIRIAVLDTGIGIDDEFLPYLFDAFQQASKGDNRKYEGSGLGLAISKELAELMGGTLGVEDNAEGRGSKFFVRIPRADERAGDEDKAFLK